MLQIRSYRMQCVGDFSEGARAFISELKEVAGLESTFLKSVAEFSQAGIDSGSTAVVIVEKDARAQIAALRSCGHAAYMLWYSDSFSKDDLVFAAEHRVYATFENPSPADPAVLAVFGRLAECAESDQKFNRVLHSLKSLVLQIEAETDLDPQMIQELKAACKNLETSSIQNEFLSIPGAKATSKSRRAPFYQAFDLSEALMTISNLERTGTLWVKDSSQALEGRVEFLQGRLVSASAGLARGVKAVYRMYMWSEPSFEFTRRQPNEGVVEQQLHVSVDLLCSDGESHRARFSRIRNTVPSKDLVFELNPSAMTTDLSLAEAEFSTLASVVELGEVGLVIDTNPLADVVLFENLINLRSAELIRPR